MYYSKKVEEVLNAFNTSASGGLNDDQIKQNLEKYGPNKLPEQKQDSLLKKLLRQLSDVLIIVLILAAAVSFLIGERLDAIVIMIIVILNTAMAYIQEARAEKAIAALKELTADTCKVIRNGSVTTVRAETLVPGDIVILESGDKVPGDGRLLEVVSLEISEAVLTGESKPVSKSTEALLDGNLSLGDRTNMVYKDTTVVFGRGKAVIVATGEATEIGKISKLLKTQMNKDTPLGKELDVIGKKLSTVALGIIIVIFGLSFGLDLYPLKESFLMAISLAVAAIPEGLPAVVTLTLALGVSKLARKKAVVRRLQAVETLGSTNYILTDKTGTLTQNKMTVTNIATTAKNFEVSNEENNVTFFGGNKSLIDLDNERELVDLIISATICNDAELDASNGTVTYVGDSTETALIELSYLAGIDINAIKEQHPRLLEIPFSSNTKKMVVAVEDPFSENNVLVYAKGAPEVIEWMVTESNERVIEINENYAAKGLRSLAFSKKVLTKEEFEKAVLLDNPENVLSTYHTFLGIIAQKDPVRPEVKKALETAKKAGIETLMLTGDHKLTAISIAKELGLIESDAFAIAGAELEKLNEEDFRSTVLEKRVFARVSPEQKLAIVNIIKAQGHITAVTGDGVNDAPAIKAADIGISMGITGTDVSKEVSDIVLQDDNYATIVEAIRQGRIIYDNLVKFITYLISCNISEILVVGIVLLASALITETHLPLPLLPIHILWINLVTDGLPALSLGMERGEKDVMLRAPRKKGHLLNKKRWRRMLYQALLMTGATTIMFSIGLRVSDTAAQTLALTTLSFAQLFHAFNNRSEKHSVFSRALKPNKFLLSTLAFSTLIQVAAVYTAPGNLLLKTAHIEPRLFLVAISFALLPVIGTEFMKATKFIKKDIIK